jgi:hypothetical protein
MTNREPLIDDDDEWVEIEKTTGAIASMPDITVRISKTGGLGRKKALSTIALRRDAGAWIRHNGLRFKIQIGGKFANKIRIIPDTDGKFSFFGNKGTMRSSIGHINFWPDENRGPCEASWHISDGLMVLELRDDFARPTQDEPQITREPKPIVQVVEKKIERPQPLLPATTPNEVEEGNRQILVALGVTETFPREFGGKKFTPTEAAILEVLLKRTEATKAALMAATHDPANGDDDRDDKIIDVFICRLRQKLGSLNIEIGNKFGGYYRMAADSKGRLRAFLAEAGWKA